MRWRPIDTAPKMRTIVLLAVTKADDDGTALEWKLATGSYRTNCEDDWLKEHGLTRWEWDGHLVKVDGLQPTHWMPLPPLSNLPQGQAVAQASRYVQ